MTDPRHQLFIDGAFADAADGATLDAVSPPLKTTWINLS